MIRTLPDVQRPPQHIAALIEQRSPFFWQGFEQVVERAVGDAAGSVVVTSWWRSVLRNREVGGVAHSQHLLGTALDLDGPPASIGAIKARAKALGLIALGPYGDGHLHLQGFKAGVLEAAGIFHAAGL